MTDKQISISIAGAGLFFLLGYLLIWLTAFVYETAGGHIDGGDDGLAFLGIGFCVLCALIGFFLSARWARERFPEFEA